MVIKKGMIVRSTLAGFIGVVARITEYDAIVISNDHGWEITEADCKLKDIPEIFAGMRGWFTSKEFLEPVYMKDYQDTIHINDTEFHVYSSSKKSTYPVEDSLFCTVIKAARKYMDLIRPPYACNFHGIYPYKRYFIKDMKITIGSIVSEHGDNNAMFFTAEEAKSFAETLINCFKFRRG